MRLSLGPRLKRAGFSPSFARTRFFSAAPFTARTPLLAAVSIRAFRASLLSTRAGLCVARGRRRPLLRYGLAWGCASMPRGNSTDFAFGTRAMRGPKSCCTTSHRTSGSRVASRAFAWASPGFFGCLKVEALRPWTCRTKPVRSAVGSSRSIRHRRFPKTRAAQAFRSFSHLRGRACRKGPKEPVDVVVRLELCKSGGAVE